MPLHEDAYKDTPHAKAWKSLHRALCKARCGIRKAAAEADDSDFLGFADQTEDALQKACHYARKAHGRYKKAEPMDDDDSIMKAIDDEEDMMKGGMEDDQHDPLMDKDYDELSDDGMAKGDYDMDGPETSYTEDPIAKGVDYVDDEAEKEEAHMQKSMLARLRRENLRLSRMLRGR